MTIKKAYQFDAKIVSMTATITFEDQIFTTEYIIWDRDSFFIDFNSYWSRLTATIAQFTAENTTKNWSTFNLVRTEVIKTLGIDLETLKSISESSPLKIMPVNSYPYILAPLLSKIVSDISQENIVSLLKEIINKSLNEGSKFITESIISKNIEKFKNINKLENILITNDSEENNFLFLKKSGLENAFQNIYCQINKDELKNLLIKNALFITDNDFLKKSYEKRNLNNVLVIKDLGLLNIIPEAEDSLTTINIDGASRGNPGPSAIGIVFKQGEKIVQEASEYIGTHTNNHAEYTALIRALEISHEKGFKKIEIKSDSELVVKQINKTYKVKDADIKELFDKAIALIGKFPSFKISYIPREENLKADKLANNALNKINVS